MKMINIQRFNYLFRFSNHCLPSNRFSSHESKGIWPWSTNHKNEKQAIKIIKPKKIDCDDKSQRILDPECKVAVILGGATDMGLNAADCLLHHGARAVVLADDNPLVGKRAAEDLCNFYGKNRARYLHCDLRSFCQLEGVFEESICRYKRVDVLFSNLDRKNQMETPHAINSNLQIDVTQKDELSNTAKAITIGLKFMGLKNKNHSGGIIVNAASIIGFMGWPNDPIPVYCSEKEPVVETTMDLAKLYPVEKTGVRLVAVLRSRKPFDEIGLPDFPTQNSKNQIVYSSRGECEFSGESRIGKALLHIMLRAETGSTWLSEPVQCTREIPWKIFFPKNPGETIDPKIYERQKSNYLPALEPVPRPIIDCPKNCEPDIKCKEL